MTTWIKCFCEGTWQYFEIGDDRWARRQVDLDHGCPVTAASWDELEACADLDAVQAYERRFGVLAEEFWQDFGGAVTISVAEFEQVWATARRTLLTGKPQSP